MSEPLLTFERVEAKYGAATALHDVSFRLPRGASMALLGRNGMGKTSTLRSLMRFSQPLVAKGHISLDGRSLASVPTHKVSAMGIGYVPQGRHIFKSLTTLENLLVAKASAHSGTEKREWTVEQVLEAFPALGDRRTSMGGSLSGGEQQMLAVGRALMTSPQLLVLDEPSEGLAPAIVDRLFDALAELHRAGLTILLAEQDLHLASRLCDHFVVLRHGTTEFEGQRDAFMRKDDLRNELLGLGSG